MPTIVLVRHAQALHNVNQGYSIPDPPLSDLGIAQCAALRASLLARFAHAPSVAIIASPMRRTLQTALLSTDWLLHRARIEADPDWQENADYPCDTGSDLAALVEEFPGSNIDWSAVREWPGKTGAYAYSREAILRRAGRALDRLRARPEALVVVFSHAAFLRLGVTGCWFSNADYRVFEFVGAGDKREGDGDEEEEEEELVYGGLVGGERDRPRLRQGDTPRGGLELSRADKVALGSDLPE